MINVSNALQKENAQLVSPVLNQMVMESVQRPAKMELMDVKNVLRSLMDLMNQIVINVKLDSTMLMEDVRKSLIALKDKIIVKNVMMTTKLAKLVLKVSSWK